MKKKIFIQFLLTLSVFLIFFSIYLIYFKNISEIETPISTQNFIDSVRYRAADLGRLTNTDFAEGFTSERLISVNDIFDLK